MKNTFLALTLAFATSAMADTFTLDPSASQVEWKAGKKIGSFHHGHIKVKSGTVETDKKGALKSAQVVVDMKTIANEDLKEKPDMQKKLVGHLSSDDFFNVEKFPESSFALKSVKPGKNKDEYTVSGDLTMIGKTVPVSFPATIKANGDSLTGQGKLTIERLKWGLQYGSGSIFKALTADKIINDSFELTLNLVGKKS
ncbi:MAG: YceI family protein [Bdellovibrionales bacterium]